MKERILMKKSVFALVLMVGLLAGAAAHAQFRGPTTPPSGANQKASVSQWLGMVEVNVTYNSPDVHAPNGDDRSGKIWGQLVPYGMPNLGFGTCEECPWRAGANQNTVFTVSHDVKVQGQPLAAGSYGLHIVPEEDGAWTIIFSNNSTSWGSFTYDAAEDALRVKATPEEHPYTEWLTYEVTDRQLAEATARLSWENLSLPWTITVDNMTDLYIEAIRNDLRDTAGFSWVGYNAAAQYALGAEVNLEEALTWAEQAVSAPFVGAENFTTLTTLSQLQGANGMGDEAEKTLETAIHHATATPVQIHQAARGYITSGDPDKALEIFQFNYDTNKDQWPVDIGMARGLSAVGRVDEAVPYLENAVATAPNPFNKTNAENLLATAKEGKDIN
jgi:tetratricopeptide (TPR) repeat protein